MIDKDKKIGYVRISSFIQNTADELRKALDQLKEEGVKGLILDLRDNPGGLLSAAVEISDLFLEKGKIVSTEGRNTIPKSYLAQKDSPYEELPLVVLINQNSASASEIVSAAPPGQQAGDDHRPAVLRQGLGAEHPRARGRQQRAQADRGQLSPAQRRQHPPLPRLQDHRQVGRVSQPGHGGQAHPQRVCQVVRRPPRPRPEIGRQGPCQDRRAQAGSRQGQGQGQGKDKRRPRRRRRPKTDDKDKPQLKVRSPHAEPGPFVDKVLDKALEVIKAKLAEEQKAKAA